MVGRLARVREMAHNEVDRHWQLLDFVLERRERVAPYQAGTAPTAMPLPNTATLLERLRYAAGVELAVMLEYRRRRGRCAGRCWSAADVKRRHPSGFCRDPAHRDWRDAPRPRGQRPDRRAVAARRVRAGPRRRGGDPLGGPGEHQALQFRAAEPATMDDFIEIEAPSMSVDGLYARIYATLLAGAGTEEQVQAVRTLTSEGGDHFQTFLFVREWLGRHAPSTYLVAGDLPTPPEAPNTKPCSSASPLLTALYDGYKAGIPAGAGTINAARASMLGQTGIEGALDAVAAAGLLVKFDPIADPRFAPIPHP